MEYFKTQGSGRLVADRTDAIGLDENMRTLTFELARTVNSMGNTHVKVVQRHRYTKIDGGPKCLDVVLGLLSLICTKNVALALQ